MKRREFFKRALAPLAAAIGLKPDTAPRLVNTTSEYFPVPPDSELDWSKEFCHMAWVRCNSTKLVWHEKPLPRWGGKGVKP